MAIDKEDSLIRRNRKIIWLIGLTVFLLECMAGYYYNVYVGYFHSDGISRVANAFYVLYSRNPHLGAIGFVWNPLPSLIDLVFLFLYPWIPAMATKGIAGLLMSAIFASLTVSVLSWAFLQRRRPLWEAVVFPLLYSLNPIIFLFGFNGMSDASFVFFVILSIVLFLNWLDQNKFSNLVTASFALACAFWARYEAVPFGFSMIVSCVIVVILIHKFAIPPEGSRFLYKWSRVEGILAIIVTPLCYSVILWILLNAIIMHNPLYFLNGDYSNTAQIQGHLDNSVYTALQHNFLGASIFALRKIGVFSAPLISILILRLLNRRFLRWDTLILLGMFVSIPLLQVIMLVKGTSLGWLRYFMYVYPISLAWLPYELTKLKQKWQVIIPITAVVASFIINSYVITQPALAPDENSFVQNTFGSHNQTYYDEKECTEIAHYLDTYYPDSTILTDSFSAYLIILESRFPKRFFISSDFYFNDAISNPESYDVGYILIPKPGSASVISAINNAYPNLFDHGAEWAKLVKEFGPNWRLYKVIKSTGGSSQ